MNFNSQFLTISFFLSGTQAADDREISESHVKSGETHGLLLFDYTVNIKGVFVGMNTEN